jgi:F-type H+-transporting ATPase subunit epsilon
MAATFTCHVVSAEEEIYSGEAQMLIATGTMGELGILARHAPLLSPLIPGPVVIRNANNEEVVVYVSGGTIEVQPKEVIILADTAIRAHDVDEAAALEAQKQAEHALHNQSTELNYSTALLQLIEATAQLRTLQAMKKKLGG